MREETYHASVEKTQGSGGSTVGQSEIGWVEWGSIGFEDQQIVDLFQQLRVVGR